MSSSGVLPPAAGWTIPYCPKSSASPPVKNDPTREPPWPKWISTRCWSRIGHESSVHRSDRRRSATDAAAIARSITSGTSAWPNEIVSLFRMPPHSRHAGLPRRRARARAPPASAPRHPHERHIDPAQVPCTSMTCSGELPARWCSPSMFCVISACSLPRRSRSTSARCPALGSRGPRRVREPALPREPAHLGVGEVVRMSTCARPSDSASTRPAVRGSRGCPSRSRCPRRSARRRARPHRPSREPARSRCHRSSASA